MVSWKKYRSDVLRINLHVYFEVGSLKIQLKSGIELEIN